MFPKRSTWAPIPGGITVVESYWLTMAGPSSRFACQELLAVVVAGGDRLQLAVDAEPRLALVRERLLGRLRAVLHLRDLELGHEPDAPDADVRQLDVRLLEAARVLALVDVVEVGTHLLDPVVVDRAGGDVDAQLVALAEVAAVADALEEDLVGCEAVRLELGRACSSSSSNARCTAGASSFEIRW